VLNGICGEKAARRRTRQMWWTRPDGGRCGGRTPNAPIAAIRTPNTPEKNLFTSRKKSATIYALRFAGPFYGGTQNVINQTKRELTPHLTAASCLVYKEIFHSSRFANNGSVPRQDLLASSLAGF